MILQIVPSILLGTANCFWCIYVHSLKLVLMTSERDGNVPYFISTCIDFFLSTWKDFLCASQQSCIQIIIQSSRNKTQQQTLNKALTCFFIIWFLSLCLAQSLNISNITTTHLIVHWLFFSARLKNVHCSNPLFQDKMESGWNYEAAWNIKRDIFENMGQQDLL